VRTLIVGIDQSGRIIQHDRSSLEVLAPPGKFLLGAQLDDLVAAPKAAGSPLTGLLAAARRRAVPRPRADAARAA